MTEREASPPTETTPLAVVRSPTRASSRSAASSSSTRRASAAAARVSVPPIAAVRLASVKPSVDRCVSAVTRLHLLEVEIQFLGRDLQQRRGPALAELDVARVQRRGVVGMNRNVGIDCVAVGRAGNEAAPRGGRCARLRRARWPAMLNATMTTPVAFRNSRRATKSCSPFGSDIAGLLGLVGGNGPVRRDRLRRALNRRHDPRIHPAAAEVAVHRRADLLARWAAAFRNSSSAPLMICPLKQ